MNIKTVLNSKCAYTHAGVFHADDVFSSALLKYINRDIHIIRTFNPPNDNGNIVFDIGGGRYDHHGEKEYRSDIEDSPYAAFGLLWKELGPDLMGSHSLAKHVEKSIVIDIDKTDNYGQAKHPNILSSAISSMNPSWNSIDEPDACFERAVNLALVLLSSIIEKELSKEEARQIVLSSEVNDGVLILEEYAPWKGFINDRNLSFTDEISEHNEHVFRIEYEKMVKFCVYPSQRGGYNLETLPSIKNLLTSSNDYDEFIISLKGEHPADEYPGCKFVHSSGFLASFDLKDQALDCAKDLISKSQLVTEIFYTDK